MIDRNSFRTCNASSVELKAFFEPQRPNSTHLFYIGTSRLVKLLVKNISFFNHASRPLPLSGKICVVTGGGSGIGLAFVKLALDSGAKCLIADSVQNVKCDVTAWSDLSKLPSEVEKCFGAGAVADIWVPSAGVFEPKWSSWLNDTEDNGYATMKINAEHPLKLSRIAMRSLLGANKPGVIMLLSSGAGLVGSYPCPMYVASKHAVVGFAKSMAQADVDESVKVVCICPGVVDTPLWTGDAAKDIKEQYKFSRKRSVTPREVALAMKEMVEDEGAKYPGGSLLRIAQGRELELLDVEQAFANSPGMQQYTDHLYGPVRVAFRQEREGANTSDGTASRCESHAEAIAHAHQSLAAATQFYTAIPTTIIHRTRHPRFACSLAALLDFRFAHSLQAYFINQWEINQHGSRQPRPLHPSALAHLRREEDYLM
ncbi:hypothetical protein DOTSEDRAFT_83157 [Dothistroma septosporum NZE10]|uniref:Uncharacterized protein n=1 Tax=Dothistroma septosporum (strain NZE10 / CBS 128990) TaxID=675120 RepID=M2XIW4_DOTSN|nr:hypothetical protein DOTSEDRAFT_83157 [Dothistroma septosporum NZE10]